MIGKEIPKGFPKMERGDSFNKGIPKLERGDSFKSALLERTVSEKFDDNGYDEDDTQRRGTNFDIVT